MNIADRKLRFVQEFLRITGEEIIGKLEQLLSSEKKKRIRKALNPLSIDELNKMTDQLEDDFKKKRYSETDELLKSIDTWE